MGQPRRAEADLRRAQTVALGHQHVLHRDFQPVEFELAMAAVLLRPHDRNAAQDAPAGLVLVIEEGGEAAARILGGARDQDEMRGAIGAGDEPFAPAHDVAVVALLGARQHHGGIGARAGMRLGHHEGRAHLALDDGAQPFFLLLGRADFGDEVHVAVVGRHAVDGERAEDRARRFLVDRRPGDDRQPHAAEFLGRLAAPTGRPSSPSRAPARAGACGIFSWSEKFSGSASSGSTSFSTKARTRRRISSTSGDNVKSIGPLPFDLHHLPAVDQDGGAGDVAAGVRHQQQQRAVEVARTCRSGPSGSRA